MTPAEIQEVAKIVSTRLPKCGIHRIADKDITAMVARIIFERGDNLTKKQVSNRIVEECRQDYVNFRERKKNEETGKWQTKRWVSVAFCDYLSARDGAGDDNAMCEDVL